MRKNYREKKTKGVPFGRVPLITIIILLVFNLAQADIKFIPKEGKLWVKAGGELLILKSPEAKQEYFALKMEDGRLYILLGELSGELKKLTGKKVEIDGLLRERIESIPSIEARSVKEIAPRGEK